VSDGRRRSSRAAASTPSSLTELGLRSGDTVRFRRRPTERWTEATVVGREKDGSVSLRDANGAARAIAAGRLHVRATGPRGGPIWVRVADRAAETEQLDLL
jgi:hypothetical protein